jgi:hypothetical protein
VAPDPDPAAPGGVLALAVVSAGATVGPLTSPGGGLVLARLDSAGNWRAAHPLGGNTVPGGRLDLFPLLRVDAARQEVALAGQFYRADSLGGVPLTDPFNATSGTWGGVVGRLRLPPAPAPPQWRWVRPFVGYGNEQPTALAVDGQGQTLLAGVFTDSCRLGPTLLTRATGRAAFVARLDSAGRLLAPPLLLPAPPAGVTRGAADAFMALLPGPARVLTLAGMFIGPRLVLGNDTLHAPVRLSGTQPFSIGGFVAGWRDPAAPLLPTASAPARPAGVALQAWPRPVPAGQPLHVQLTRPATLRLRDALGRTVATFPVPAAGETALPTAGLRSGLYLLHTQEGASARIVVE